MHAKEKEKKPIGAMLGKKTLSVRSVSFGSVVLALHLVGTFLIDGNWDGRVLKPVVSLHQRQTCWLFNIKLKPTVSIWLVKSSHRTHHSSELLFPLGVKLNSLRRLQHAVDPLILRSVWAGGKITTIEFTQWNLSELKGKTNKLKHK